MFTPQRVRRWKGRTGKKHTPDNFDHTQLTKEENFTVKHKAFDFAMLYQPRANKFSAFFPLLCWLIEIYFRCVMDAVFYWTGLGVLSTLLNYLWISDFSAGTFLKIVEDFSQLEKQAKWSSTSLRDDPQIVRWRVLDSLRGKLLFPLFTTQDICFMLLFALWRVVEMNGKFNEMRVAD